jgi:hypothetical protein
MRRALSILFAFLFALGPLAATFDEDESSLPACCRRNGTHHCLMSDAMLARIVQAALSTPAFTSPGRCPQYPLRGCATPSPTFALAQAPQIQEAAFPALFPIAASGTWARNIHLRTPALRGPPSLALPS